MDGTDAGCVRERGPRGQEDPARGESFNAFARVRWAMSCRSCATCDRTPRTRVKVFAIKIDAVETIQICAECLKAAWEKCQS